MKIAILMDRFEAGGVTTHNITLAKELLERGHQILLYTAAFVVENLKVLKQYDNHFSYKIWGENKIKDIEEFNPDIIHAHPFEAINLGFKVSTILNKPLIVTSHGRYPIGIDKTPEGRERYNKVKDIIAVDFIVLEYLLNEIPNSEKITVIPNGIDLDYFQPIKEKSKYKVELNLDSDWFTIVSIGRLGDGKQSPVKQVIDSISRIQDYVSGFNLVIVGGGPYLTEIEEKGESLFNDSNLVNFKAVGHQYDIRPYLGAADLVLACDRAALEAMACYRPVLGAYGSGVKEILNPDSCREFMSRYEDYQSLTNNELEKLLINLANKKRDIESIVEQCYNWVKNYYNIKRIADQHEAIYQKYL